MGNLFQKKLLLLVSVAIVLQYTGCATIVGGGSSQAVTLKSEPSGAMLKIYDKNGACVHSGIAPMTVTLKRGAGYFKGQDYRVSAEKEGYATGESFISRSMNGWYVGNILFGGLIGLLIVDPATGSMYKLDKEVTVKLKPNEISEISSPDITPKVISLNDIPYSWRPYLKKL